MQKDRTKHCIARGSPFEVSAGARLDVESYPVLCSTSFTAGIQRR